MTGNYLRRYGAALVAVIAALLLRLLLDPLVGDRLPLATVSAAIAFVAWYAGRGPAVLALVAGSAAIAYFIMEPRGSLQIGYREDIFSLVFSTAISAGIIVLFEQLRMASHRAARSAAEIRERFHELQRESALRQKAEAAAAAESARLRVTLASIGDGVITTDAEGRVVFLNDVAEQLTGWTLQEARGLPLAQIFQVLDETSRRPVENPVDKVLRQGRLTGPANHTILIAKDGAERPVEDSAAPIRDESGVMVGVVLTCRDVTGPRRAQKELQESEALKRSIVESALDCVVTMDHAGKIIEFNPAAEATFGYSRAQAIGQDLAHLLIPPSLRERHAQGLARYLATGEARVIGRRIEISAMHADGSEFMVELAISRLQAAGTPLFTAYIRDISERVKIQQQRTVRLAVTQALNHASAVAEGAHGVLQAVCENLAWEVGTFWILDEARGKLVCLESWHQSDLPAEAFEETSKRLAFAKGEGLPGRVWATGAPAWIRDIRTDGNFPRLPAAARYGLHSGFAYPVIVDDNIIGVFEFFSRLIREPDVDLLEMMSTVAGSFGQFNERQAALKQLRQSEAELADFFENSTIGLHWVGPDGTILRANEAELQMLGYSREEYVGRPITDFHADQDVIGDILACLKAGERIHEYPARLRCKDGSVKDVLIDSSVMFRDGAFVHSRCFTRDVTERKSAESALRESEERFRQLADAMPQIVWTARPDGIVDYQNRQWYEFTGLREARGNEGWAAILHPDDAPRARERWAASLEHGAAFEMEIRLLDRKTQGYRWHLLRTVAVRDEDGNVIRWYGTGTDIDQQKRAEESSRYLAEASAELAAVVDYERTLQKVANLAVPYFADWSAVDMANPDGTLRRLAVAHRDADKIAVVHRLQQEYPPEQHAATGSYAVLRSGKPQIVSDITDDLLVHAAKDARHLALIRSLALKSFICVPLLVSGRSVGTFTFATAESGRRYDNADLVLAMNLANRASVAIENAELYQALRESDRRKDEFLATLAHELRNPLAPISNALQILKMVEVDAATLERSRNMMERQLNLLVRLVDDLLDVSRVTAGKIELQVQRVELASVVERAVEMVQPLIDMQGHELSVELPDHALPIDADPMRLSQVIGNILTNAAKYSDPHGRILLSAEREGFWVVLRIRDYGIGIAAPMLSRIFQLFVQVDHAATKAQGGLGIGLTLAKNLVDMHGGSIEAHSEGLGKGSEFVVRLPLSQAPVPNEEAAAEHGKREVVVPSGLRLLVIDDNQDAALSLEMLLKLQGHDVAVAHSGTAALAMTDTYKPDVVFLDIGMPGMDGYEVARRLRRQPGLENVVLVAVTGWGQQEDRERTSAAGFNHHVVKPPELAALQKVLADLKR